MVEQRLSGAAAAGVSSRRVSRVLVDGKSIGEVVDAVGRRMRWRSSRRCRCASNGKRGLDPEIAGPILKEVVDRLRFLENVGLDYLTLERSAATLSGGEAQRIRLATQIGSRARRRALHPRRALASGCTSATTPACWTRCASCAISATRSWWWSTTRRRSAPPTMWSTWVPGPGAMAARSSRSARLDAGAASPRLAHRPLSARRAAHPGAAAAPRAATPNGRCTVVGARAAQPARDLTVDVPARAVRRGHRRVGLGEVDARHRHPLPGAGAPLLPGEGRPRRARRGSRGSSTSTR